MTGSIFESRNPAFKSRFGAVEEGTDVIFRIRVPMEFQESYVGLVIKQDGQEDQYWEMVRAGQDDQSRIYQVRFSFEQAGLYWYFFKVCTPGKDWFVRRDKGSRGEWDTNFSAPRFQQTVYEKDYTTPDRNKGGIFYQIFPDRFCYSGVRKKGVPEDRILRSDWGGQPFYRPNEKGEVLNNDYFCGDLEGIRKKLPYLAQLGVTCIYCTPIFEAHSNHRYNVADYRKVDPLLGSQEDFSSLCQDAKRLGIDILLDGVFSHTGSDSVYFNREGRYPPQGAYNTQESPYFAWYRFEQYPDQYHSWWGFQTLPETDECNEDFHRFICGEGGVIDYWLSCGASGFRLDVADELPDPMLDDLREAVKRNSPEALLIGEVWEDASNKESYGVRRRYLQGRQLDSVMNYPFREAVLELAKNGDLPLFLDRVWTIVEHYPKQSLDVAMNSLSTHDTARAITELAGESSQGRDRDWQSHHVLTLDQYALGKKRLMLAMAVQYFLPGIPCIYYGDEAGMQGYRDPFNRGCFPWGHEDQELLEFAKQLGKLRRSYSCFAKGKFATNTEGTALQLIRWDETSRVSLWVNPAGEPQRVFGRVLAPYEVWWIEPER